MIGKLRELYQYREMIVSLVRKDLKGRYKGSVLGFLWTFLNPLLQLLVYTLVFSVVLRSGIEHFSMFLFTALIPWIFFSASLTGGAECVISQKDLVQKIYFPREVLPIAHVTGQFVNMLLSFVVVFAALLLSGIGIRAGVLWYLLPVLLSEYLMALGAALLVSALTVYFRDLQHVLPTIALAWQFLTPVMYPLDLVPETLRVWFLMNPMTPVITAFRDILYYKQAPEPRMLLLSAGAGLVFFLLGWVVFGRLKRHFAERL